MSNIERRSSSIMSQGAAEAGHQVGVGQREVEPRQFLRSRSKLELRRRLQEIGQGLHHGSKGLPGVKKGLIRNQSEQVMFVQYDVPGQKKKVLIPANIPYRVKIPRKGSATARVEPKRNSMNTERLFSAADNAHQLAGEIGVGEKQHFTFYDQPLDGKKNSNQISGRLIQGQGAASRYNLRTLNDEQIGGSRVPKLLHLNQLNKLDDPNYSGENERAFDLTGRIATMPMLSLAHRQSHEVLNTDRPGASQNLLNTAISSRELRGVQRHVFPDDPQFQKLNMAPYLRESREFVKAREASRGAVRSALAGVDGKEEGVQKAYTHRGTVEPTSTADLLSSKIPKRERVSKASETQMASTNFLMATSQSRPVLSQMTGMSTMTPLGPAMGTLRSLSKSKIEQHSHRLSTQKGLSQTSKQNILFQIEQRALQRQIHDPQVLDIDGAGTPNSNTRVLENIRASKQEKQVMDTRISQIKQKLKEEQREKKEHFKYMQHMAEANSRQDIIPGETEAKDEAIRQQLLIGKLRNTERFPEGFGGGAADLGQPEQPRGSEQRAPFRGYQDGSERQQSNHVSMTKESIRLAMNSINSRGIPQVLSDQGSGVSGHSSTLQASDTQTSNIGKPKSRPLSKQRSDIWLREHVITKVPSKRGLGHISRSRDYKPHDHLNLEESPEAKQYGGFFDEKGSNHEGVIFTSTFKEPEPEMMKKGHNSVSRQKDNDMDTQLYLENLICQIQNDKTQNSGYFIYLRQNKANPKNPYDLVPFKFKDKRGKDDLKATPDEDLGNRANTNLHVIENYQKNRSKQILQKDQRVVSKVSSESAPVNKYYTLSKQGITTFLNNEPIEFTKIENWLAERAQFNQISQKKFFKKFRSWKIMRMWRLNILSAKREEVTANLKGKLFMADAVFGQILLQHRYACKDLEKLRVLDFQQVNRDAFSIVDFQQRQMVVRELVENTIKDASNKTRDLFKGGINEILDALRAKIHKQDEIDQQEEMAASIKIDTSANSFNKNAVNTANEFRLMKQIEKLDSNKNLNQDPVYEQLGFKHNLKFSARSELREACKKFLRFGFLLDFIALESLSNIYLNSIHDCIDKLKIQVNLEVSYDLESSARVETFAESKKEPEQRKGANKKTMADIENNPADMQIPLFFADCLYKETEIPAENMYIDLLDPFALPPLGSSEEKDFNPMAHLEVEEVAVGSAEEEGKSSELSDHQAQDGVSLDSEDTKLEVTKVRGLHALWLNIYPDKQDLSALIKETFQLGFDSLKNFEKWSMHADLQPYDQVLEPWDYRSYERWEPPNEENELSLNCDEWLQENAQYQHLEDNIEILITNAMHKIKKQFERLEPILEDYWSNKQLGDFKILTHEGLKNPIELLPILLQRFVNQKDEFANFIPQSKDLGLLRVRFNELTSALSPQPKNCLNKLKEILPKMIKSRIEKIKRWMEQQIRTLKVFPTNVDEYVSQIQCLEYIEDNYQDVKDQVELNDQIFQICERFDLPNREDKSSKFIDEIYQLINTLNSAIYDTKDKSDRRKEQMKKKIGKKIPKLNYKLQTLLGKITDRRFLMLEGANVPAVLEELQQLEVEMAEVVVKKKDIHRYQKTLDMGMVEPFNNVEDAKVLLSYNVRLWSAIHEWNLNIEIWQVSPFEQIDVEDILDKSQKHARTVLLCERNLPETSTAVRYLKNMVFDFKETMPTVEALGNKDLKDWHWTEIKTILSISDFPLEEKQFSLGQLVDLNVAQHADEIVNISVTATQEFNLQVQLSALASQWHKLNFEVVKHQDKDALKLVAIDVIQTALDESMQTSSLIVGSRYIKRLQTAAQAMQDGLNLIYDTLEQWRECQRNWLYLENLFSSQDIRKQRAKDFQEYENINKSWIKLMKQTKNKPAVYSACGVKAGTEKDPFGSQCSSQRLNDFSKWNKTMDKIQKNLEEYLEEKREEFPRFYFISNDELLQILANSADLKAIEKHANKCFENISSFILQDELVRERQLEREAQKALQNSQEGAVESKKSPANHNSRKSQGNDTNQRAKANSKSVDNSMDAFSEHFDNSELNDIYGIKASQEEKVKFGRTLKIRGQGVEVWMKTLEEYMVQIMQKKIKDAYNKYYDDLAQGTDRNSWVLHHLSQAVAVVDQMTWTESTEGALNDLLDDNPFAMEDHLTVMKEQLSQLTELIRGRLTAIQRMSLVALITQDVHCRDIVEQLQTKNVQTPFDFIWQQQLRYYFEEDLVVLRQVNSQLNYGYEYMGPTSRLVITPLTDKCWITITGAMHIKLGAAPAGPAGTGKTESTKDLAKACGIFCLVINCSDQIEYKMMAKLFSGLVQSGAWSCLDEFNRINIEVLSVIAQQLLDIKEAKVQGKERFIFNEQERALKQQCAVFITMNPGYAGRTELPDNLKVLFRPVSMMIPNYGLIAEIMLFAEGFSEAKALSTKMVQLYKLASEQLSQQDHYDFGLRAVKSVLVMAGNLKRAYPELQENIVLIRAMRDSNIPKFLAADLPLFSALIQDLFPGVEIPETQHVELEHQIAQSLESMKLQNVERLNTKIIQLFETLNVRFGVMIVGPTGGGKTTTYKVLADSMAKLRLRENSKDERFQEVKLKVLNPKSISMGELYGEENIDTQEWTDGLASKILRKFAQIKDSKRKNWCVLDGPVDALWIENMNTVLDDNMTLCLVNGERIKLNHNIRILFEVQDLAVASPATVSRCGMVYITPSDLGWRPYFDSWIRNYISRFLEDEKLSFLVGLFEMFVDLGFEKMKVLRDREILPTQESQNVQCLCNFIEHFIKDKRIQQEEKKDVWQKQINSIFAFSMIWGIGASFDKSVHRWLDNIFRDFFGKLHLPPKETVFQYFYHEKEMRFRPWEQILTDFETRIVAPYDQLYVPTIDSVSYTKILSHLTGIEKRTFFTGSTGVGKSIIIQEFIQQNSEKENFAPIMLNFSAQTSSISVQKGIESKLVKKRGKKVIGAKGNQHALIFIDDINMPRVEQYGAQPPIEFLRLLLDGNIIYDRPNFFKKSIEKFKIICAAAPPGGGRARLTPRFLRHFHIINIPNASEEILTNIFETVISDFLSTNHFSDPVRKCGNIAVAATIDMFTQFNQNMLPIPSRFHYLFNMRDVSKVFQGILMTQPQSVVDSKVFTKLWLHECQRVFHDRLIDNKDRQYFKDLTMELIKTKFKENWAEDELFETNIELNKLKVTFSMILKCDYDDKLYEEIEDPKRLLKILEDKMLDYNFTFTQSPMSLIFFEDAIDHICRIARILNQPRGNAMLIGVSGSGKQSLTKLAAFLHEASCSQIKLSKNYKPSNFRDDMKQMLLDSGCERKPNVFLLADTQIIHEQFLEDINCILNTGEIADLYEKEDFERMEGSLSKYMKEKKAGARQAGGKASPVDMSQENIYLTYVQELRLHFHIILCMSPVGEQLRIRCRNFPSLVNCCTLDWFDNWPQEALKTVSVQFFKSNLMINDNEALREAIAAMFPQVHNSVQELATRFYDEQKRRVYITPKTYLDALNLFKYQLGEKQQQLHQRLNRLKNGIDKLEATNMQIAELQITLTDLVPKLKEKNKAAELQASEIQKQTILAQKREQETENEARIVMHEARQIQNLKEKADFEVGKAKPALMVAEKAVNELSKDDITELKKVNNPIKAVLLALECTLIYLGYKNIDWKTAQKALADIKFLEKLKTYDRDSVPDKILKKVKELTKNPDFNIERMVKASKAAGGLAKWCKAIREYAESLLIVRPLLAQQAKMTEKLKDAQDSVDRKQKDLAQIKERLSQLQGDYQNTLDLIQDLKNEKVLCEKRLSNASKLLELLVSEGERWKEGIGYISDQIKKIIGDVFISVSQMSYLGPFTGQYREILLEKWTDKCVDHDIDLSADYSLVNTLGDPIEIRKWGICGLPNDSVSVDNAIFTMKSHRWPMLIDPQFQGNSWLKRMFKSENAETLRVLKVEPWNREFSVTLEAAIRYGYTLVLEDMSEEIDASIDQIVSKAIFKEEGVYKIVLGTRAIDYDLNFKLFLTTKMANPHFLPEVSIQLSVINFTVTFDGLDDQLLAEVVQNLEPEVERMRDQLIIEISAIKNEQFSIQASILASLAESNQDTILDNEILIQTLQTSKTKSIEISQSLKRSEEIEQTVQEKREQYRKVSVRGSILYFVIASLASIDPMYQNSLTYVQKIFTDTIQKVVESRTRITQKGLQAPEEEKRDEEEDKEEEQDQTNTAREHSSTVQGVNNEEANLEAVENQDKPSEGEAEPSVEKKVDLGDIETLLTELLDNITSNLYVNICRGLFESHKLIYSFLICTSIRKNSGSIDDSSYNLLLRGQGVFDRSGQLDYRDYQLIHEVLSESQWDLAYFMEVKLKKEFSGLIRRIIDHRLAIKEYLQTDPEESASLLDQLPEALTLDHQNLPLPIFQQLLLIKLFKPQQLLYSLKEYVVKDLGKLYSVSPLTSMGILFNSADKVTPIIFVLSQGADPNEQILGYAKKMKQKLQQKSLGQGQERDAERRIAEGKRDGDWILLQNCHLFKSWMPKLENICNQLREEPAEIHPNFRLILTSMPADYFPASILQNGVKMTTEPPQGLKANLKRIFTNIIDKDVYELADMNSQDARKARDSADLQVQLQKNSVSISHASENSGNTNKSKPPGIRPARLLDFDRQFDLSKCWKSMLFGLSFFHSIIQERKKFGSMGWNKRYEFNDSDLDTSIKMLRNFIEDAEEIPWDSMQFMTGHINYGGRVTDDNDRILLISLLKNCYGQQLLDPSLIYNQNPQKKRTSIVKKKKQDKAAEFSFFDSKLYKIPKPNNDINEVQSFIESLPNSDMPEIFGMHKNASISYQQNESNNLIKTILNVQMPPVVADKPDKGQERKKKQRKQRMTAEQYESGGKLNFVKENGGSSKKPGKGEVDESATTVKQDDVAGAVAAASDDSTVMSIAQELFETRPLVLGAEGHAKEIFKVNSKGLLHCYSIVLLQEQERYNRLIRVISDSLEMLIKAIQGLVLMSPELDQMYTSLLQNQVPANWESVAHSSLKTLASWYQDLHKRVGFMRTWMTNGHPSAFWLSGFFFPHGFVTGVLQAYARKHLKAIDFLKFKFDFLNPEDQRRRRLTEKEKKAMDATQGSDTKKHGQQGAVAEELLVEAPEDGVYVYGLFIESAVWSKEGRCITEQRPGVIISAMPIVHFLPFEVKHKAVKQTFAKTAEDAAAAGDKSNAQEEDGSSAAASRRLSMRAPQRARKSMHQRRQEQAEAKDEEERFEGEEDQDLDNPERYPCPVYKTSARAGVLSTTGQSTNYILSVSLPIDSNENPSEHWTLRGAAILSMLDD